MFLGQSVTFLCPFIGFLQVRQYLALLGATSVERDSVTKTQENYTILIRQEMHMTLSLTSKIIWH